MTSSKLVMTHPAFVDPLMHGLHAVCWPTAAALATVAVKMHALVY